MERYSTAARLTPRSVLTAGVMAVALAAGCGDDVGTEPVVALPDEIVARWLADPTCEQCGFTVTSQENPADSMNVVRTFGLTVVMDIEREGAFRLTHGVSTTQGTARVASPGVLVIKGSAGSVDTMDYAVRAGMLDISLRRLYRLDVSGDGVPEDVRATGTFRRQQ